MGRADKISEENYLQIQKTKNTAKVTNFVRNLVHAVYIL
jgi:hypothetical protein